MQFRGWLEFENTVQERPVLLNGCYYYSIRTHFRIFLNQISFNNHILTIQYELTNGTLTQSIFYYI